MQPYTAYITDDGCLEVVDSTCKLLYSTTLTPGRSGPSVSSKQKPLPIFGFGQKAPPRAQLASNKTTGAPRKKPGSSAGFKKAPLQVSPFADTTTKPSGNTKAATKPPKVPTKPSGKTKVPLKPSKVPKVQKASPPAKFKASPAKIKSSSPGQVKAKAIPVADTSPRACTLAPGELCGGINHCGLDRDCASRGCCAGVLACRRDNEFSWRCQ